MQQKSGGEKKSNITAYYSIAVFWIWLHIYIYLSSLYLHDIN